MSATILPEKSLHYPVLLKEVLSIISPQNGGTFIDCTFGQGGYTKKILEFPNTKVIALDRDIKSKNVAKKFKNKFKEKDKVPRPSHWSGWNLKPSSIEFWLDGENRIHERLKYTFNEKNNWTKSLLSP